MSLPAQQIAAPREDPSLRIRPADLHDVDRLIEIEEAAFRTDRLTRRSFRDFLRRQSATVLVAERDGRVLGYAIVLFRRGTAVARLYSIAVDPVAEARGAGAALLAAVEKAAVARDGLFLRLEVRNDNARALAFYRRHGFRDFGRLPDYYEDHADALRLEKSLLGQIPSTLPAPLYYSQTTEFTCGPACLLMVLNAFDPSFPVTRRAEVRLWREATTVFMTSGLGGCEPVGLGVALAKRGLAVDVFVSAPGPYFLDSVRSPMKQEVMRAAQEDFAQDAEDLGVPIHIGLMSLAQLCDALDEGAMAIVLISAYRMYHERYPHWIVVYGREQRHVFAHDPWIETDDFETAIAKAHLAIPLSEFERMWSYGKSRLRAAILVKGRLAR